MTSITRAIAAMCAASMAFAGLAIPATASTCSTQSCSITSGHYYMINNWWGVSGGVTGHQSITFNSLGSWSTTYSWSGGSNYSVKTYAEVVDGWNWGGFNGSPFPYQISGGHSVNCNWTLNDSSNGTNDVSWDCFFDKSSNPGDQNPNGEMMVWMQSNGGAGPAGSYRNQVTVDGWQWNFYEGTGDWQICSYVVAHGNGTSFSPNLMDFAKETVNEGFFGSSWYFLNVDAGTEAFTGSGTLTTTSYSAP